MFREIPPPFIFSRFEATDLLDRLPSPRAGSCRSGCRDEEFQLTHVIEMPCGKTSITKSILVPFEKRLTPRGRDVLDSFFHLPHIEKGLIHISRVVGSTATATEPINSKD